MNPNHIELGMQHLQENEGEVFLTLGMPDEAVWLPKSQIEIYPSGAKGIVNVTMPEWLATEKGLV